MYYELPSKSKPETQPQQVCALTFWFTGRSLNVSVFGISPADLSGVRLGRKSQTRESS